ncbi:hypothetical protein [Fangia hongkongensis]|uniref:hypothetical protein n=1 Tax=Fangia hongkongensis TaxID=270495 RepID=UPI000379FDA9|nr:hypothetical protein [Fangia hongkongensis]MBK2124411.1 hypothetical protein [Fangia hongkongensis]
MKYVNFKKLALGSALICLTVGMSYAVGFSANGFTEWGRSMLGFFNQIKTFIQIIATVVGLWFIFSSLQLFRKHHTNQGAQGEHVKHGSGHLAIGIALVCLVPFIQMLQTTLGSDAGNKDAQQVFQVQSVGDSFGTVPMQPITPAG